jgi:poly(ADP-ribose) glycohydrolase ARH3
VSAAEQGLDRAHGALLGTFVGDALGMPYEGCSPEAPPRPLEMVDARLGRGTYTDDTQMMIALAESLLARRRVDQEHLARTFLGLYDPRRGYGAGTTEVLARWRAGEPVASAAGRLFDGRGSLGNGAAMRIAPVAVRFAGEWQRLLEQAEQSAVLTHSHPLGIDAAVVQAAAIGAALRGDDILATAVKAARTDALLEPLRRVTALRARQSPPREVAHSLGNTSAGPESVPAALYAATAHGTLEAALTFAVACGGDTDTIAAMAGAVSGAQWGAGALPARWLDALEDGHRGRRHVAELAEHLHRQCATA